MNSGSQEPIAPFDWKLRSPSAKRCWKQHEQTVRGADRKQVEQHRLDRDHDRPERHQEQQEAEREHEHEHERRRARICWLKSCVPAVSPVTATAACDAADGRGNHLTPELAERCDGRRVVTVARERESSARRSWPG